MKYYQEQQTIGSSATIFFAIKGTNFQTRNNTFGGTNTTTKKRHRPMGTTTIRM